MQTPEWSRYADPVTDLIALWREKGIELNPGATKEDLDHFEQKHKLQLPPDFRKLYRLANGMPDSECDDYMLSLWSLDRIEREQVELAKPWKGWPYILFADGMLDACFYAVRFRKNALSDVVVIWELATMNELPLANSVSELAARYLAEKGLPGLFID